MNKVRGFTLIELLVVIAIIGILSAVVLASLNTVRGKASDTAVKADLRTITSQAQSFLDDHSSKFSTDGTGFAFGTCPTTGNTMFAQDNNIKNAIAHAASVSGGTVTCYMNSTGTTYVVWSPMKTSGTYWCIDSNNFGKQKNAAQTASDVSC